MSRSRNGRPREIGRRRRAGFSLAEVIVAMTLLAVVTGALMKTIVGVMRSYGDQTQAARSSESLRAAELLVTRSLRQARADALNSGNATINPDPTSTGSFDNVRIRSDLNSDGDVDDQLEDVRIRVLNDTMFVKWYGSGPEQAAAYPVRSLQFEYFNTGGTAITTSGAIPNATRVRLTIAVPKEPGSNVLVRRQSWVYLRN